MESVLVKRYRCTVCGKGHVFQRMIEHHYEGEIPDQGNCDFSRYSDEAIVGGKLLKNRPAIGWTVVCGKESGNPPIVDGDSPEGGICSRCLESDTIISKLVRNRNIKFISIEDPIWNRY